MLFNILLYLKESWERRGWQNCTLAPPPLPSHFHFSFYKLTSPLNPCQSLMPVLSWCYGEGWSQKIMSPSALAPRPSCFLSHPLSLLPFHGGQEKLVLLLGVGRASGQLTVTHPHDREPPPGSGRLKTVKQTFLTLSPYMMLRGSAAKKRGT